MTCNPTRQIGEIYIGLRGNMLEWFSEICEGVELGIPVKEIPQIVQGITVSSLTREIELCRDDSCRGIEKFGDDQIAELNRRLMKIQL